MATTKLIGGFLKLLECHTALGMESGEISDTQIKASSEFDSSHGAIHGRLHCETVWRSATLYGNQWLQVDLGNHGSSTITRVATQGGNFYNAWVTKYKLQHSNDEINFQYYRELGQIAHKVRYTESKCRYLVTLVSRHVARPASRKCYVVLQVLTGFNEAKD